MATEFSDENLISVKTESRKLGHSETFLTAREGLQPKINISLHFPNIYPAEIFCAKLQPHWFMEVLSADINQEKTSVVYLSHRLFSKENLQMCCN